MEAKKEEEFNLDSISLEDTYEEVEVPLDPDARLRNIPAAELIKQGTGKDPKKGRKVKCILCGRWFKSITQIHVKNIHRITLSEYAERFPNAPINYFGKLYPDYKKLPGYDRAIDSKQLQIYGQQPPNSFVDRYGCIRDLDTKKPIQKITKTISKEVTNKPLNDLEKYLRTQIGWNGEEVFNYLLGVMNYDQKKMKHKNPLYNAQHMMKAAEMLLHYGFGKPKNVSEKDVTVKKLEIKVGMEMPDDMGIEDF